MSMLKRTSGFTIVELLIVIVVIGILAAITIVAFNGVQTRANNSKISSDLQTLSRAIQAARINTGQTFFGFTGVNHTGGNCITKADGTDHAALPTTDSCWTRYAATLALISNRSGINVNDMKDPWGRPYYIDENEGELGPTHCTRDKLAAFGRPHVYNAQAGLTNAVLLPNSMPGC